MSQAELRQRKPAQADKNRKDVAKVKKEKTKLQEEEEYIQDPYYNESIERWTKPELVVFGILALLSFSTRFFRLAHPSGVVFDEVHFVSMAQWYKARKYFFDIHPPLGKLILALIAWMVDFHTDVPYRNIETPYQDDGYVYMRMWQAFWGALLPLIGFLTVKQMGGSFLAKNLAGFMLLFELSLQTISRNVLLDSFLYAMIGLSFLFALKTWHTIEHLDSDPLYSTYFWKRWWLRSFHQDGLADEKNNNSNKLPSSRLQRVLEANNIDIQTKVLIDDEFGLLNEEDLKQSQEIIERIRKRNQEKKIKQQQQQEEKGEQQQ